jgi:hypothetical protein
MPTVVKIKKKDIKKTIGQRRQVERKNTPHPKKLKKV